jgi:hypothetical protein
MLLGRVIASPELWVSRYNVIVSVLRPSARWQSPQVVLESSGHYYWPLASHLHRRGYGVSVVNPLQAKYFAKSRSHCLEWRFTRAAEYGGFEPSKRPPSLHCHLGHQRAAGKGGD